MRCTSVSVRPIGIPAKPDHRALRRGAEDDGEEDEREDELGQEAGAEPVVPRRVIAETVGGEAAHGRVVSLGLRLQEDDQRGRRRRSPRRPARRRTRGGPSRRSVGPRIARRSPPGSGGSPRRGPGRTRTPARSGRTPATRRGGRSRPTGTPPRKPRCRTHRRPARTCRRTPQRAFAWVNRTLMLGECQRRNRARSAPCRRSACAESADGTANTPDTAHALTATDAHGSRAPACPSAPPSSPCPTSPGSSRSRALFPSAASAFCRAAGRPRRWPPRASPSRPSRATPARPRSWTDG